MHKYNLVYKSNTHICNFVKNMLAVKRKMHTTFIQYSKALEGPWLMISLSGTLLLRWSASLCTLKTVSQAGAWPMPVLYAVLFQLEKLLCGEGPHPLPPHHP